MAKRPEIKIDPMDEFFGIPTSMEGSAMVKGCLAVIGDIPYIFFHNPIKNSIDKIQYLRPAAEIHVQVNPLVFAFLLGVGIVFFHKQFRSCHTETINALLYIPYHENIAYAVRFFGNCL